MGSQYVIFKRKHIIIINIVFISLTIFYFVFWSPYGSLWTRNELSTNVIQGKITETGPIAQKDVKTKIAEDKYNRLINYVLRPQAICRQTLLVGGTMFKNKQMDGDKLLCLDPGIMPTNNCTVYSFGISSDWSFDEGMHKMFGCNVYSFDPSTGKEDHLHSEGVWFYRMGIAGTDGNVMVKGEEWKMKTFDSFRRFLNHKKNKIDVFKMDIEGAEFSVLEKALEDGSLNDVNHFCMEIHLASQSQWDRYYNIFKKIEEAGLLHFSTRNNTQVPLMPVPGIPGRLEQPCLEMSWFRHR